MEEGALYGLYNVFLKLYYVLGHAKLEHISKFYKLLEGIEKCLHMQHNL